MSEVHMADVCPNCGTSKEMDVAVGVSGNDRGQLYYCGSIYWPAENLVTVVGTACKRIRSLTDALREAREVLVSCSSAIECCIDEPDVLLCAKENADAVLAKIDAVLGGAGE